jgi:hypothetical protein
MHSTWWKVCGRVVVLVTPESHRDPEFYRGGWGWGTRSQLCVFYLAEIGFVMGCSCPPPALTFPLAHMPCSPGGQGDAASALLSQLHD